MSNIFDSSFDKYTDSESADGSIDNLLKGTQVILVDSDDPWYLNKDLNVACKYIPSEFSLEFKDDNPYKQSISLKEGKYKTQLSPQQQAKLLKTHSFYERKLITEGKEYFNLDKTSDTMNRNILIALIIIIIAIYLYKRR